MAKWSVTGVVSGGKYLGTVEAETEEEAKQKAEGLDTFVSLCHQCSGECEDPEITEFVVSREGV